jgi:hypothetical protein
MQALVWRDMRFLQEEEEEGRVSFDALETRKTKTLWHTAGCHLHWYLVYPMSVKEVC